MRCTGHCCRSFRIGGELFRETSAEARQVAAMVIPLGYFARGHVLPSGEISRGGDYYDCRHLSADGDCGIYATRPQMCRDYPNGQPCQKTGCTYA